MRLDTGYIINNAFITCRSDILRDNTICVCMKCKEIYIHIYISLQLMLAEIRQIFREFESFPPFRHGVSDTVGRVAGLRKRYSRAVYIRVSRAVKSRVHWLLRRQATLRDRSVHWILRLSINEMEARAFLIFLEE